MTINERAVRVLSLIPSVFQRLIVSYLTLIFLVAVTVSGVSYFYFKSVFNRELDSFHGLYLRNIEKELASQVVDASKLIYMELSTLLSMPNAELFGPDDRMEGQASKIYSSYRNLNDLVARQYDRLEAVHIYYVQSGLLISSSGFQAGEASVLRGDGREWLASLARSGVRSAWEIYDRPAYLGVPAVTLFRSLRCFPILSGPEDCTAVICADFRADAIRDILSRLSPADAGRTALMAQDAAPYIGATPELAWDAPTEAVLRSALGSESGEAKVVKLPGGPQLLSALPLSDSGWRLVNLVPASQLYRRGSAIRLALLAICVVALGLGGLAAVFAASGIYNPLERLIGRFRSLPWISVPEPSAQADEYRVIDEALSGLSNRMDELEASIEANRPIIKHELMLRLLEGERMEGEDIRGALGLLSSAPLPGRLRAAIVSAPAAAGEASADWASEAGKVLKYRIADELERSGGGFVLASPLTGGRVGVVSEASASEGEEAERLRLWISLLAERCGARARVATGTAVAKPEDLTDSFLVARELAEYSFIFPEEPILQGRPDLLGRSGLSAAPSRGFVEELTASLGARDLGRFRSLLAAYAKEAREGGCQARACRAELERLTQEVADYARGLRSGDYSALGRNLAELLTEAPSIDDYLEELAGAAAEICAAAEDPQQQRSALLVARVKAYLAANLGADLSLDRVGEAVAASPGYMGKVFKQETGRNFVSYVNEIRLTEAARLLAETRDPIQDIGRRVGFNTPAYFIRLFKGRFGQTPLDYRRASADPRA